MTNNQYKQQLLLVIDVSVIGDYLVIEVWLLVIFLFDPLDHIHLGTPKDKV
jgi:hypothetical protein